VEALVADETKPYHGFFSEEVVLSARGRLLDASDMWRLAMKVQELRTQRDRQELPKFAEEHGYEELARAR
jgi:hypothetical protein